MSRKWTSRDKKIILFSCITFVIMISIFFSILYGQERMEHMELEMVYEQDGQQGDFLEHKEGINDSGDKGIQQEEQLNVLVDVKGAVHQPGVYQLREGDRVVDAIHQAGLITEEGTTDHMNLAQKLSDGMVIYVPTKKEIEDSHQNKNLSQQEAGSFTSLNPVTNTSGKININHASQADLETLPGIGASRAQAILEYRTQNGGFKKIEDIMNISGIGPKIFERLKHMIEI